MLGSGTDSGFQCTNGPAFSWRGIFKLYSREFGGKKENCLWVTSAKRVCGASMSLSL